MVATTSWEVVDYTVKKDQEFYANQKKKAAAKRIAERRHVVPNQDDLRPELSAKISRLYYNDQHPARTHYPDAIV